MTALAVGATGSELELLAPLAPPEEVHGDHVDPAARRSHLTHPSPVGERAGERLVAELLRDITVTAHDPKSTLERRPSGEVPRIEVGSGGPHAPVQVT